MSGQEKSPVRNCTVETASAETVLQPRLPERGPSATSVPLNSSRKLLGSHASQHLRRMEAATQMASRTAPDIGVN